MDDSDEALMALVARGDEPAYRALTRRHLPAMLGLARRILGNAADAEDVAQEAMLRVWTHAPRWQPLAAFRTWLTRVVVNLCLDRKRRARWVALEAAGELVDPAPGATETIEHDEREQQLALAIAELPARQRTAIVLTYSEGMSNAQVADILARRCRRSRPCPGAGSRIAGRPKMTEAQFEKFLESSLKRRAATAPADEAAVGRVLQRLSGPLPRQKVAFWRLPAVLLDWQFAPAWPRVAALACCAALGFGIGLAGLDRQFDVANASFAASSSADIGSVVFEPEPLTGARP
jgi:RNA polymerase sigma-70 factor (ECF subfamily)